jgi:hypothetical protein
VTNPDSSLNPTHLRLKEILITNPGLDHRLKRRVTKEKIRSYLNFFKKSIKPQP